MDERINLKIKTEKIIKARNDSSPITGVLISAGLSSRMGEFKPLTKWRGKTFISHIIDKLKTVCNKIIIVTGNESEKIEKYVIKYYSSDDKDIKCVINRNYLEGMFTSLKKGLETSLNSEWVLYHQVDQPNLPQDFYKKFTEELDNNYDWIQPRFNMLNGHPILLGKNIIRKILRTKNDDNLRSLSSKSDVKKKYWDCEYPEILTDIDTQQDLTKIK